LSNAVAQLADALGHERLLPARAVARRVTSYWNSAPMQAQAMVLPHSTAEVATALRCCHGAGQSVITHGGLTGCVAGAESTRDDVVLSLEKLRGIEDIDLAGGTATVAAGTVLQTLQETVAEAGLYFPLDLGARGSCTIGGNVATNAGGINVLRYGMMRNLVLGLEAVLADGTIVSSMNRMLKNNAGYDLKQLFIGSEGTLGVVTRVVLRLFPQPASRQNALVAAPSFEAVTRLAQTLHRELGGSLSAFELMWGDYVAAVTGPGGHRAPLATHHPFYVVLQAEGADPNADQQRFEAALERAMDAGLIVDAVIPKSDSESDSLWQIRENFEAILEPQPVYLYDVSLPIPQMAGYVDAVKRQVAQRWPDGQCYVLGHMADGNLHLFVQPNDARDLHAASDEIVYGPLTGIGGSVSAEHGIGTEKLKWLPHSRSREEIQLMQSLKRSLDPRNILNPGRVVESNFP
jgi:FAD/FMN-containing dehydrogenase